MILDIDKILTVKDSEWDDGSARERIIKYTNLINTNRWVDFYKFSTSGKNRITHFHSLLETSDTKTILYNLISMYNRLISINSAITKPPSHKRLKLRRDIRLLKVRHIAKEFLDA